MEIELEERLKAIARRYGVLLVMGHVTGQGFHVGLEGHHGKYISPRLFAGEILRWMDGLLDGLALAQQSVTAAMSPPRTAVPEPASGWVPVYTDYQRHEVAGEFEPSRGRVDITSGNLADKVFDTPSAAAMEVIRDLSPDRMSPHTNGWPFWKDLRTRRSIGELYERRR